MTAPDDDAAAAREALIDGLAGVSGSLDHCSFHEIVDEQFAALRAAGFHLLRWRPISEHEHSPDDWRPPTYLISTPCGVGLGYYAEAEERGQQTPGMDAGWWSANECESVPACPDLKHEAQDQPTHFAYLPPGPEEPGR